MLKYTIELIVDSPPHLLSAPQIHPLPLTYASRPSDHLSTAARLLSLPNPIQESGDCATKPIIEVHPTSRQVYVSLNQGAVRRRDTTFAVSPGGGVGRREYLVVMECEQAVDRVSGWSKVSPNSHILGCMLDLSAQFPTTQMSRQ